MDWYTTNEFPSVMIFINQIQFEVQPTIQYTPQLDRCISEGYLEEQLSNIKKPHKRGKKKS